MQVDRPRSISIGVHGEQFRNELLNRGLSRLTDQTYEDRLRWFDDYLKSTETLLEAVTVETLHAWISEQRTREWAPKMIRDNMSVLRVFFRWLVKRKLLDKDPTLDLDPLHVPKNVPEILQEPEVLLLLAAAEKLELIDWAVTSVFYGCAIRTGTLCALNVHDLDLTGLVARIRNKGRKDRYIPFNPKVAEAVRAWLPERARILGGDSRRAQAAAMKDRGMSYREIGTAMKIAPCIAAQYVTKWRRRPTPPPASTTALFVTRFGRVQPEHVRDIIRKVATAACLERRVWPHLFRHSAATHMHDRGADLNDVKEMLGHETVATTQIYTHTSTAKLRRVYDRTHPMAVSSSSDPLSAAFPPPAICPGCGHSGHWGSCRWTSRAPAPLETCT